MGVKCFQSKSLHILPAFPLYTGTDILRAKWSKLKEALQCFRHTQRLSHTWILREAHIEREGSRSKIQTQRDRETSTHTGRDMHSSDLHTPSV